MSHAHLPLHKATNSGRAAHSCKAVGFHPRAPMPIAGWPSQRKQSPVGRKRRETFNKVNGCICLRALRNARGPALCTWGRGSSQEFVGGGTMLIQLLYERLK